VEIEDAERIFRINSFEPPLLLARVQQPAAHAHKEAAMENNTI
jgi:hypothetical protein